MPTAAVSTVVDRRPRDRRPFPISEFADRVMGNHHKQVTAKLKGVDAAFQSAINANREFEKGRADPHKNISNALARRAVADVTKGIVDADHQV